jgi:hypothetical protein
MTKTEIAEKHLGISGTMLSASKSGYSTKYPDHLVVFNGNLIVKGKKIWYGDIDVTLSKSKIDALGKELKSPVYVLREMDARFENEDKPLIEKAVYVSGK